MKSRIVQYLNLTCSASSAKRETESLACGGGGILLVASDRVESDFISFDQ